MYGSEARTKYDGLSAADKADPLAVADMCVNIMSVARPPRDLLKEGPLREFIGFVDSSGRRPSGLNPQDGRPQGEPQQRGGRRDGQRQRGDRNPRPERPSVCSVLAPRGPMCKHGHSPPCWRDNLWEGPLPAHIARNENAVKSIEADRLANATRLGEKCVALCKPEGVNMLDVTAIEEQWPLDVPRDDLPPSSLD